MGVVEFPSVGDALNPHADIAAIEDDLAIAETCLDRAVARLSASPNASLFQEHIARLLCKTANAYHTLHFKG